jgi:uncharacterized repeat protein (TIGR01451 family)
MKSTLFQLIILISLPIGQVLGQTNWYQQNPNPGNHSYKFIHRTSTTSAFAFTEDGIRARTNATGKWQIDRKLVSKGLKINDMDFPGALIGYMAVAGDSVRKTTDGGETWVGHGNAKDLKEIHFTSDQIGFARSKENAPFGTTTQYFTTTNGGNTWVQQSTGNSNTDYFFAHRTGSEIWGVKEFWQWTEDYSDLYKSTNNGASWTAVDVPGVNFLTHVYFYNDQLGWALDSNNVVRTTNGGQDWTVSSFNANYPTKIWFISPTEGWLLGNYGYTLYRTVDGGATWSGIAVNGNLTDFHFLSPLDGWMAGNIGILARTQDGGQSLSYQKNSTLNTDLKSVEIQNKDRAWVIPSYAWGTVYKTADNGNSWQSVTMPHEVSRIRFPSSAVGYASGFYNMSKTTNGGASWNIMSSLGFDNISDLTFLNKDTGWVAIGQSIKRTFDGGNTWSTFPNNIGIVSIQFKDFSKGYYLQSNSSGSTCFKSTDGGQTWQQMGSQTEPGACFSFIDDNTGWIGGYNGLVYRTTNGGQTWQSVILTDLQYIRDIRFISNTHGFAATINGVYETVDGGITWKVDPTLFPPSISINSITMYKNKPVFAAGDKSSVYATSFWGGGNRPVVKGKVIKNENNDCLENPNEAPLQGNVVYSEPGFDFGSTNAAGEFAFQVDSGTHTLRQIITNSIPALLNIQYCPVGNQGIPVVVSGSEDTVSSGVFINEVKTCPVLTIFASSSLLRPCRNSTLQISIYNVGTAASDSEWVHIKFPPERLLKSASLIFDYNAIDSTYRFKIGPIQPNAFTSIFIRDSIICNTLLMGKILCVKVVIPNAPVCLTQVPNWDGVDLNVASKCENNQTKFILRNNGAGMMNSSQYQIYLNENLVYQAPFQLAAGTQMSVTMPSTTPAGFVRFKVPQSANHPLSTFTSAEANCSTGQSTNGMFPPPDESPLVDIECAMVRNSYDPNDKQVFPTGWGADGNVEPGTEFKYTIRFQNTGNDTAFKVVLIDTLDQDLDIASLQIGNGSHPFTFKVSGKGRPVFTWTFDNILLPDSNTNLEGSNGFVTFSIRPKSGLALGTRLENFVDIYFDYNDPVRTNTTVNTLWVPTLDAGVVDTVFVTSTKKPFAEKDLSIFPNPTKGKLEVNVPEAGVLQLYNTKGEAVLTTRLEEGQQVLNFSQLPKGLYLIQFRNSGGQVSKKVILE